MERFVLFIAGCITGYIASGYIDGLISYEDKKEEHSSEASGGTA